MGFLDREAALLKRQELERLAKLASIQADRAKKAKEESDHLWELEDAKLNGPQDKIAIAQLLDNLPDMNLEEYVGIVARHTGYEPRLVLYSRAGLSWKDDKKRELVEEDERLAEKLRSKGILPWRIQTIPGYGGELGEADRYCPVFIDTVNPREMFLADNIRPKRWFGFPISEPQEPGIGISFKKEIGNRYVDLPMQMRRLEVIYSAVYARFFPPDRMIITGGGFNSQIKSLEVFDRQFERAFKSPHKFNWEWVHHAPDRVRIS